MTYKTPLGFSSANLVGSLMPSFEDGDRPANERHGERFQECRRDVRQGAVDALGFGGFGGFGFEFWIFGGFEIVWGVFFFFFFFVFSDSD